MRICVFGAGSIGGNFATRLALAGNEVTDLRHRAVALDGVVVRKFVSLLDGTRTAPIVASISVMA